MRAVKPLRLAFLSCFISISLKSAAEATVSTGLKSKLFYKARVSLAIVTIAVW